MNFFHVQNIFLAKPTEALFNLKRKKKNHPFPTTHINRKVSVRSGEHSLVWKAFKFTIIPYKKDMLEVAGRSCWSCAVVEHILSIHEVLCSVPSTEEGKEASWQTLGSASEKRMGSAWFAPLHKQIMSLPTVFSS